MFSLLISFAILDAQSASEAGWPTYGDDPGGTRFSPASQISRTNVARLKIAWTYRTGANDTPTRLIKKAAFEATPILVNGVLFLSTPYNHVIALDAQSGAKRWEYDPHVNLQRNYSEVASRGVSAWRDAKAKSRQPCSLRIFIGTLDARLAALDGDSGKLCSDFGTKGEIYLNRDAATQTEWTGGYQVTSAPAIAGDLVIVGSSI
ncbi:MAG: pyrroloquinoline quinone-dependent dehydrogenase, partial [Acidobacteria bacterium]